MSFQLPSLSNDSLNILLNKHILKINQDDLSIPISPFPHPPSPISQEALSDRLPTHWSGPLSTGETVLMIINPYSHALDITFEWRRIPAFHKSTALRFEFMEVSKRKEWMGGSTVGFVYTGIPAHGSLVMIVWEGKSKGEDGGELVDLEWTEE
jgi:hypothetical protein